MKLEAMDHRSLVRWATKCAERALPCFEAERPSDDRPRKALEAARAWVRGELGVRGARAASVAAHAAARAAAPGGAARAAARAAGQAVATAHAPGHAVHAAAYAATAFAIDAASTASARERGHQRRRLPPRLRSIVFSVGKG